MKKFRRIAILLVLAGCAWFFAFYLFKKSVAKSLIFKEVSGPKYFHEEWPSEERWSNYKMKYPRVEMADCYIKLRKGSHSNMKFLRLLTDYSGYSILVYDEENKLDAFDYRKINSPDGMIYFKLSGMHKDSERLCDASVARIDGNVLLFNVGSAESFVEHYEGWGILCGFAGIFFIALLWRD